MRRTLIISLSLLALVGACEEETQVRVVEVIKEVTSTPSTAVKPTPTANALPIEQVPN